MSLDAVKILEISITINSKNEILEFIQKSLTNGAKNPQIKEKNASFGGKIFTIVTPNPEQIVYAQRDFHFREFINQADVSLPDGVGLVWAGRLVRGLRFTVNGKRITQAIPGIEFMENLVSIAAKQRVRIALIGGRSGLALSAFECLQKTHPKLNGWATDGPEMEIRGHDLRFKTCPPSLRSGAGRRDYDLRIQSVNSKNPKSYIVNPKSPAGEEEAYFNELAHRIIDSGVRIVFVGLGAPKQEYFIDILKSYPLNPKSPLIFMSVGGSFDEIAGRVPRAPQWVGKIGLKWLWRLIFEPWRIRRQFALFTFTWLVMRERYRLK